MLLKTPDGVELEVPMEFMAVKDSIFVPTLVPDQTQLMLRKVAENLEMKLSFKTAVVDGYLGVLFQRIM